ncbi:MAG: hypothetical protein ACFFDH_25745 [Promethearchaeota archaeon]
MLIIEEFRKIIKNELENLWKIVHREVNEYFDVIDFANITYRKNYTKLSKPERDFLNDPLNIPEIYKLLYSIKENNFNYFDSDSVTKDYNHYRHGYYIRDHLLIPLEPIVKRVESFRIETFNRILENQEKSEVKKIFIVHDFQDYELKHYDYYINIINGIAYHKVFYIILPNLLRCVFENLLYDIYQTALDKKHTQFFFLKGQTRARDFSQLIALLNILKDKDFQPYHKNSLNQSVIDVLKKIQKFGNLTVHQILRQIDKDFAKQWQQKINRVLLGLLVLYKNIRNKNLEITDQETLTKINKALNMVQSLEKIRDISITNKEMSIQEYLLSKKLNRDVDKTLAIGYFMEKYKNLKYYNIKDLEKYHKKAKEKMPKNLNFTIYSNVKKGFMMEVDEKKNNLKCWCLTQSGITFCENNFKKE